MGPKDSRVQTQNFDFISLLSKNDDLEAHFLAADHADSRGGTRTCYLVDPSVISTLKLLSMLLTEQKNRDPLRLHCSCLGEHARAHLLFPYFRKRGCRPCTHRAGSPRTFQAVEREMLVDVRRLLALASSWTEETQRRLTGSRPLPCRGLLRIGTW